MSCPLPGCSLPAVRVSYSLVREVERKMDGYIAYGVLVAVMIDPDTQTVATWRRGGERVTHPMPTVEIGSEMPGFAFDAAAVLRAAEPS